ncbi:MAG: serine/threonine protein kinase [Acidimicrobiales bacterium]|nr:serine/threonine protein kinase [Acidimicrobiales bacterium]
MTYEFVRRLGRGGMGVVDLERTPDGREVAVKRLSLHGTPEELETARTRIRREAEVLQQLRHPNVVQLEEVIDDGDDLVLVMSYLSGGNLSQRVATQGPLSDEEIEQLADALLDALATAHRQGIVHRDIKPANVLFAADGTPALADFGVASHRDVTAGLTAAQMVVGTPGFMSPEQARGDKVTAATDIFSLGATLLFAATGQGPFGVAEPKVLMLRATAGQVDKAPRSMSAANRLRIDAMLAAKPEDRPSAAALRGGTSGLDGVEGTKVNTAVSRVTSSGAGIAVTAAVAVASIIGVGALLMSGSSGTSGSADNKSNNGTTDRTTVATIATTTTKPCVDLPYQPCGEEPAPNTDGKECLDESADYDQDPVNGCEATPQGPPDGTLIANSVQANLVPTDDTDTYQIEVEDNLHLTCDGTLHVTLTAPFGATQRVRVLRDDDELASAISSDGAPAVATARESDCFGSDAGILTVVVESVGSDRSPENYTLEVSGSF